MRTISPLTDRLNEMAAREGTSQPISKWAARVEAAPAVVLAAFRDEDPAWRVVDAERRAQAILKVRAQQDARNWARIEILLAQACYRETVGDDEGAQSALAQALVIDRLSARWPSRPR